jgi:hypothetical protein
MDDLSDRYKALGGAVADVSDRASDGGPGRAAVDRARRSFLAPQPVRRAMPRARTVALLAAACGVVLTLLVWLRGAPRSLSFTVGPQAVADAAPARPGVVGDWVASGADRPVALRFSDTSALDLAPGARARVTTTSPQGADVLIERGLVHAAIAHAGAATRWAVRAGPFEVRVTGTEFDASWDPMTESFELVMQQGSVVVTGPLIPPERAVVAGERLRVSVRDGRMELTIGPQAAAPVVSVGPQATPAPAEPAQDRPVTSADPKDAKQDRVAASGKEPAHADAAKHADPAPAAPAAPGEWRDLAAAGKYRDALAAAEAAGFETEVARASSSELMLLADAARLGGSPARARFALLAARARFGARGHTAFLLGKIAADQGGSPGEAITWMETYLREAPGGPFAEQALGRIVELSRRDPDGGARAAARYLARYPNGAHAALARSLAAAADKPAP